MSYLRPSVFLSWKVFLPPVPMPNVSPLTCTGDFLNAINAFIVDWSSGLCLTVKRQDFTGIYQSSVSVMISPSAAPETMELPSL